METNTNSGFDIYTFCNRCNLRHWIQLHPRTILAELGVRDLYENIFKQNSLITYVRALLQQCCFLVLGMCI